MRASSRVACRLVHTKSWTDYVKTNSLGDPNYVIAQKVGVDPATIGRWFTGRSDPKPRQVVAFARAYGHNPVNALVAAGFLSAEDFDGDVKIEAPTTLDHISTNTLVDELERRMELMSDYAGWIRSIAAGEASVARLSEGVLRYLDPAIPPASTQGIDFVHALGDAVSEIEGPAGEKYYGVHAPDELSARRRARDVGGSPQDLQEVANDTIDENRPETDADFDSI